MVIGRYDFHPPVWATLACVIVCALLASLGVWQLHRAAYKRVLYDAYAARAQAPAELLDGSAEADPARYRHVRLTGTFDRAHQFLLDNRIHASIPGYDVLTPMHLDGSGPAVLVNRGWVPLGARRDTLPAVPVPAGRFQLTGIVDLPERSLLLGPAGYRGGGWPRVVESVEIAPMERLLGYRLEPYVVLMDPAAPHGFVREWRPNPGFGPQRHLGYAFQWFALAVTLFVIYVVANSKPTDEQRSRNGTRSPE